MSRREDIVLSAREKAVFASLEAVAEYDDPKLARRLATGLDRLSRRRRSRMMSIACIAAVVLVLVVAPTYMTLLVATWLGVTAILLLVSSLPSRQRHRRR